MRVYIGHEPREQRAYDVAVKSMLRRTKAPVSITPLNRDNLERCGLLRRPTDLRGSMYDLTSNAPCSTGFAISRFLTPILAQNGLALFVDSDVVFLGDVTKLFALADYTKAVQVVKHYADFRAGEKMDGQAQVPYERKGWSSVMLFNVGHPGNRRLTLDAINHTRGIDLHQFCWLHDSEIGELPYEWNWLVGVMPKPAVPQIAHFTEGGPFLPDWAPHEFDDIWLKETL
jgi:hypothetical protein